jgi:hypothetical protein
MPLALFLRVKSDSSLGAFPTSQTFSSPRDHKPCPRAVLGRAARSCMASGEGPVPSLNQLPAARETSAKNWSVASRLLMRRAFGPHHHEIFRCERQLIVARHAARLCRKSGIRRLSGS